MSYSLWVALALAFCIVSAESFGEWNLIGESSPNTVIPVSVALKIRNADWLSKTLEEVSNPKHPNWRQYVTREELKEKTAPAEIKVRHLVNFLEKNGMIDHQLYPTGDFIMTSWKVADAERLFKVFFNEYSHSKTHQRIHRATSMYSIPSEIEEIVDVLGMVTEFPEGHFRSRTSTSAQIPQRNTPKKATSNDTCNSVLNWGYPATSDTDLYSQVQIVCCDGQFTKNLTTPCFGHGEIFEGFQTEIVVNSTSRVVVSELTGYQEIKDRCYLDGESITCQVDFTKSFQVQSFENYNIYVTGVFGSTAQVGIPSMFPVKLITSPFVTPELFRQYYEIPNYFTSSFSASNNSQSVVEFGGQYYSPSDLANFFGNMSLPNTLASVVGYNNASVPGDEATLDIEWIMAVGTSIDTIFWSVNVGYLLEWTQQLLSSNNAPLVNSVSYGGNEANSPVTYRNRCDSEFQKLGVLGITVVVSSGDAGATNVGHGSESCSALLPQYPAASPYVTSVSATFFTPTDIPMCSISYYGKQVHCTPLGMGEVAVSADNGMDWTTGGGFSSSVPRPSWQNNAVNGYLNTYSSLLPPASMFNSSNRGYPDVSATGHNLMLILRDAMDIGDGTSASAPIFTGVLALINQYLLSIGENPVGFVNPLLYQVAEETPASFYDVTVGGNNCGDVLHPPYVACCDSSHGYHSSVGWDPVTGLGTPRFSGLFTAIADLVQAQKAA